VKVELSYWPQVADDFKALPTYALQAMAMKHLVELERRHNYAQPLTDHPIWGDLSDCWKIFLDESHDADPRWRIIYRLLPDAIKPTTADVIIIGPREDDAVYVEIMSRLNRPFGPEHPHFVNPS